MTVASNAVAIVSPLGGAGRTTLSAHLAPLVAAWGAPCLAIDLCAQNMLGRHLGLVNPVADGWASLAARSHWWGQAALSNSNAMSFMPFGMLDLSALDALRQQWARQPDWLPTHLHALELPAGTTIILDTPVWPSALSQQAIQTSGTVLVVLDASARACQAQNLVVQAMAMAPAGAQCAIAINRFDPRRPSHRAALQTLRAQWGSVLLPYTVHEDENLARACDDAISVCSLAPHAQSSHDLQGIATWLYEHRSTSEPTSLHTAVVTRSPDTMDVD